MKKFAFALIALAAVSSFADEYVRGHYRKDGTYVEGHHRTAPDNNPYNNYSTQGNTNPWTGQQGTVSPYSQQQPAYQPPSNYAAPRSSYSQQCGYTSTGQYVCR